LSGGGDHIHQGWGGVAERDVIEGFHDVIDVHQIQPFVGVSGDGNSFVKIFKATQQSVRAVDPGQSQDHGDITGLLREGRQHLFGFQAGLSTFL
jgi:hypothetical protein